MKPIVTTVALVVATILCGIVAAFLIAAADRLRPDPTVAVPANATVVYVNLGGNPVRVLRIDGCLYTENWQSFHWLLRGAPVCPVTTTAP